MVTIPVPLRPAPGSARSPSAAERARYGAGRSERQDLDQWPWDDVTLCGQSKDEGRMKIADCKVTIWMRPACRRPSHHEASAGYRQTATPHEKVDHATVR